MKAVAKTGKFDGILLLSDLDDTFRGKDGTVEEHSRVIRYFTENGGRFAFATGRTASYMPKQAFFGLVNAPCCIFNGGLIYDYSNKKTIRHTPVDFTVAELLAQVDLKAFNCKKMLASCSTEDPTEMVEQDCADPAILDCRSIKLVFVFESIREADCFAEAINKLPLLKNSYVSKSWTVGVEVTAANATKGHAFAPIKAYLGNIRTTVGVGNYYNDIPLLQYADIGIAVDNAPEAVKAAADIVVPACNDYGFRDVIRILEERAGG